jgi:stalled ribosome rescue protein Dom34
MERLLGIWIDYSQTIIGEVKKNEVALSVISSEIDHQLRIEGEGTDKTRFGAQNHSNNEHRNENRHQEQVKKYIKTVYDEIKNANAIYIIGPAEAKKELVKYYTETNKNDNNIVGVEACDKITENQLKAKFQEFYTELLKAKK